MTRKADPYPAPEDLFTRLALPPPSCSPAARCDSSRFARIAAGVGFALTQDLALTLAAKARLPHEGNHEYGVSASLELALP